MNAKSKYTVDASKWEGKLKELDNNGGGVYVFPQVGKTMIRLLLSPEREAEDFYNPVLRMFKGKGRTQFMAPCLELSDDEWNTEVKYLVTNKTVISGILQLLANGYDLLSPEGHGVLITRSGEGLNTKYNVMPSANPVPVDYSLHEFNRELIDMVHELEATDREDQPEQAPADEDIPW